MQGNAALTTQGGLWKTALKEQVTQYLEKRIMLSDIFYDRGALDSAQLGSAVFHKPPCVVNAAFPCKTFDTVIRVFIYLYPSSKIFKTILLHYKDIITRIIFRRYGFI
jgi:hypothetical protein